MNVVIKVPSDAGVRISVRDWLSASARRQLDRSGKHLQTDGYDEADTDKH